MLKFISAGIFYVLIVIGCGSTGEKVEYMSSTMIKPLKIPPGLDEPEVNSRMKMPEISTVNNHLNDKPNIAQNVPVDLSPPDILSSN